MKGFLWTLTLFLIFTNFADAQEAPKIPSGLVVKLRGEALFEGKNLKVGDIIDKVGKLQTKEKSFIQLKIDKWKNTISIGPNSIMDLNFSDEKKYTLQEGFCRWKSFAKSETKGKIFTKTVSMGVRGTDFLIKYNETLGETEIIMFDGEVVMENLKDVSNSQLLTKGQWCGVGGRFGEKIANPLNLPKTALDSANQFLE